MYCGYYYNSDEKPQVRDMKAYRIKKHRMENVKIRVIVQPDEERMEIPKGGKYDVPPPPPLAKPRLLRRLFTKVHRPSYDGKIEFTFEGEV
jgi:hypothetical protein